MRSVRIGPAGWDVVVGLALVALAAVVWWQAGRLPPPTFDPIGPAAIPKAVALVIAVLGLTMCAVALQAARAGDADPAVGGAEAPQGWPALRRALAVVAMLLLYGGLLEVKGFGFTLATILFVAATGILLSRGERRVMLASVVCALILAFGCRYVFTQIFYIDLP